MSQPPRHRRSLSAIQVSRLPVLTMAPVLSLVTVSLFAACEVTIRVGGKGSPGAQDSGADGEAPDGGVGGEPGGYDGGTGGWGVIDGPSWRPNGPPPLHAPLASGSKVDLLFLIDDSNSMAPLQAKMRAHMTEFVHVLKNEPIGMPDVHMAVVSSSLGAGVFGNVTGCLPGTSGNLDGTFQHKAGCGLHAGQAFLKSTGGGNPINNFDGDIADVFSCIADIGQSGCGFEHQLESVRLALQRTQVPGDQNAGFLRPDALLAVVFLTNEDDCSVPADSMLFDPHQQTVADSLGGLQSYRCNEFGHICDQELPHSGPSSPVTLTNCRSREDGKLVHVNGFIEFLYSLKPGAPQNIFVALIAGPTGPYVVQSRTFMLANGNSEMQPTITHSCTGAAVGAEYADPAVRLSEVAAAFAPNSMVTSICAEDFSLTMTDIAHKLVGK